jgi:hypothetical protein
MARPDGVYLDTSILLTLSTNLNSAKLQNFHAVAKNLGLRIHAVRLCVDEYIQERREQLSEKRRKWIKCSRTYGAIS